MQWQQCTASAAPVSPTKTLLHVTALAASADDGDADDDDQIMSEHLWRTKSNYRDASYCGSSYGSFVLCGIISESDYHPLDLDSRSMYNRSLDLTTCI